MLGKQHLFYGLTTSATLAIAFADKTLALSEATFFSNPAMLIGGAVLGSLLPDIDSENSMIAKACPLLAKIVNSIFGHRELIHDLGIFSILAALLIWKYPLIFGFWLGYLGHLFLDGFTEMGIPVFYFINKKRIHFLPKFMRFKSNSFAAKFATFVLAAINVAIIFKIKNTL